MEGLPEKPEQIFLAGVQWIATINPCPCRLYVDIQICTCAPEVFSGIRNEFLAC